MAAVAVVLWKVHGRERVSQREREKGGGLRGVAGVSRRSPWWPERQAGGGHGGHLGASTQVLHEEDKQIFAKSPFGFGGFSGIFETALVCIIW
jgi:hypothetical protein